MAWIESHQGLALHPKTKKLVRKLGIPGPHIVGYLHYFWWWALDFAQDGEITQYDPFDVADACEWKGDPHEFYNALIDVGFIDVVDEQHLIHDWHDYAGKLIEIRKKDAERKRKSRGSKQDSEGSPPDIRRTSTGRRTESIRDLDLDLNLNHNQKIKEDAPPRKGTSQKKTNLEKNSDKTIYAEFVRMKPDEYEKLVAEHGKEFAHECIITLDNHKGASGKTYASDYRAILKWVVRSLKEERVKVTPFNREPRGGGQAVPGVDESKRMNEEMERLKEEKRARMAQEGSGRERTPNTA